MLSDGIQLLGASTAQNFTIESGSSTPGSGNTGELFYVTGVGLHVYDGSLWNQIGSGNSNYAFGLEGILSVTINTSTTGTYAGINVSNEPVLVFTNAGAASNSKYWGNRVSSNGTLIFELNNDAMNSPASWLTVSRAAAAANTVNLTASTINMNGTLNATGSTVLGDTQAQFSMYTEKVQTISSTTASQTIDCSAGGLVNITLSTSITSLTFSNVPSTANAAFSLTLFISSGGSKTVTWPSSVKWPASTAPTLTTTSGKVDVITLITLNGGTSWFGFAGGLNF